jgi:ADP-heptose:LPS heptosyltransferase
MINPKKIIISRTDAIGDVVLTLPLAGALKQQFPECELVFLGRNYTRDVVVLSENIDRFLSWDEAKDLSENEKAHFFKKENADAIIHVFPKQEIAKASAKAKIPYRIGSTGRIYHYRYCNKLVPLSRKNSPLHEAQLNFKLLKPFIGSVEIPSLEEIQNYYGLKQEKYSIGSLPNLLDPQKFNLILHPKSKGSAREWPLENYSALISLLTDTRFKIFVTGTDEEGKMLNEFLNKNKEKVTDLTGKFTLKQLIDFIGQADGLVAASTGPLYLAASLGKLAIGIYPPIRPMDPGRWAPIGKNAHFLVLDKACNDCRKTLNCHCINDISPKLVVDLISENAWKKNK